MQNKKYGSLSFIKMFACALVAAGAVAVAHGQDKIDPSGTWTWENPSRGGRPATTNTLVLKYANDSLTGTLQSPKRGGGTTKTEIAEGKLTGAKISFNVTREFNGNSTTATYSGTVSADSITGTISTERDGEKRSRKWEAKKSTSGGSQ